MRVFCGIPVSSENRLLIFNNLKRFQNYNFDVKWIKADNLHITLKFFGEIEENLLTGYISRLSTVKFLKFKLDFEKICFLPIHHPRIVYLNMENGAEELKKLVKDINNSLNFSNSEDLQEFLPHLTLGRIKSGKNIDKLIEKLTNVKIDCSETVEKFVLYESILKNDGPVYFEKGTFKCQSE